MKKLFCIVTVIALVFALSGCDVIQKVTSDFSSHEDAAEFNEVVEEGIPDDNKEEALDEELTPEVDDGGDLSPIKIANAPVYHFGKGKFELFSGEPYVHELSESAFIEYYNGKDLLAEGEGYELSEVLESVKGGELLDLLVSSLINANGYSVARGAAVINGAQQYWTFFHIQLTYPDTRTDSDDEVNTKNYNADIATIFANCDSRFVMDGYQIVVVSSRWNDDTKELRSYRLGEGTFLEAGPGEG